MIAADAGLAAVVTDPAHLEQARGLHMMCESPIPHIVIHAHSDAMAVAIDPIVDITADALACIIYTSGSTGSPKGVVQTHGGIVIQVGRYSEALRLTPADRLSGLSGYAYDAAIQDIFGALLNGATVCPLAVRGSGGHLAEQSVVVDRFGADSITVMHATPSLFRYLFGSEIDSRHDLSTVRAVVLGGEAVRRSDFELYRTHFARGTQFVNGLGLTESTVALQFVADHDTRLHGQWVPVGTPVAGLDVDLIDDAGVSSWFGEIVLTGSGLSPGYWPGFLNGMKPALSSLHTGDIGRRLPDGQIIYVGRRDGQINVRGYRVELGEIETTLSELPGVADSAARVWYRDDDAWLAAYVVAEDGAEPGPDKLRAALANRLPPFMLPQTLEILEALPRLANGKLARDELPAPRHRHESGLVPARSELESELLSIWGGLLQLGTLGIHDNFFTLGGHSLLATRVIARIRDRLDLEVPLASIFDAPTVAGLAVIIESVRDNNESVPALMRIPREGHRSS
jgi:acyl-coenzyme A synthetase/AMP-(fatty) acid ligase/acyl carrier protein